MSDGMRKDWRDLCVTVANESDSTMLTSLVQELIEAIKELMTPEEPSRVRIGFQLPAGKAR